jgi:K+-sensing histidine kinase KdpD
MIQTIYDIIKAHDGEMKVESKEDEGAEFIIQLPISDNIESKSLNPVNHGSDNLRYYKGSCR